MSSSKRNRIFDIAVIGVLIAVEIILSRFLSISVWNMKIGFSFIPVVIAARRFGAPQAMIIAALGDFLGAILFPIGAYFPGFTLTAVLTAFCTAFFIHKECSFKRILASVLINQIAGSLLLNTLWISILYGSPFFALLPTRVFQVVVMSVVQVAVMQVLLTKGEKILNKRITA
jgi:ECF transporter S component (folate family)